MGAVSDWLAMVVIRSEPSGVNFVDLALKVVSDP